YQLNANGFPPHAIQNVVVIGTSPVITLTENTHYVLDKPNGTIQFLFGGLLAPGSSVDINYEYGLPRYDLIVLDSAGVFSKVKGIAAQSPIAPNTPIGTIQWAVLTVRDLAASYLNSDLNVGVDYKALT